MKKTVLCLFMLFLGLAQFAKAQDNGKHVNADQLKGTYQIEFLKSGDQLISITEYLLKKIEEKRDATKTTYLPINETCRVKILSRKEMNTARFKEEYVIVESFQ